MKRRLKLSGQSQTEYLIIVVLVAITVMFSVGLFGKQIKSLFERSTKKLSLFDTNDSKTPEPSPPSDEQNNNTTPVPPSDNRNQDVGDNQQVDNSNDNIQSSDEKQKECQQKHDALLREYAQREFEYQSRMRSLNHAYNTYINLAHYYSRSRWHWGGFFGGWHHHYHSSLASRYYHLAANVRRLINSETAKFNAYKNEWNERMNEWKRDCGDS